MAARKKTKTTKTTATTPTTGTRTKRTLADRVKKFDLDKLAKLKTVAEDTIRVIAAEGLRREQAHRALQDTSVLDNGITPTTTTPAAKTTTTALPYSSGTGGIGALPNNGRSQTTSP